MKKLTNRDRVLSAVIHGYCRACCIKFEADTEHVHGILSSLVKDGIVVVSEGSKCINRYHRTKRRFVNVYSIAPAYSAAAETASIGVDVRDTIELFNES